MKERFGENREVEPKNLEKENLERFMNFLDKITSSPWNKINYEGTETNLLENFKTEDGKYIVLHKYEASKSFMINIIKTNWKKEYNKEESTWYGLGLHNNTFKLHTSSHSKNNFHDDQKEIILKDPEQVKKVLDNFQKRFDQYEKALENSKLKEKKKIEEELKEADKFALNNLQDDIETTA